MRLGMKMGLRDGAEMSFLLDRWVDGGDRLIDLVSGSTADIDADHQCFRLVDWLPACHRLWLGPERTESLGDLNATGASESALHICLLPKRRGALLTRSGG
ncbi:hypothetical protein LINPERHAP2_LOCUS39234 [Linum perenne]